jgi:hypothetical protein
MDIDLNKLKSEVISAMRKATPKDTGNLAYNSLRGYPMKSGLKMVYHGKVAGYGKILHVSPRLGNNKKNKHVGWHDRASSNAILAVRRFVKDKTIPKGSKMLNTRQESKYNPEVPGTRVFMNLQKEKWFNNPARVRFETMNKV